MSLDRIVTNNKYIVMDPVGELYLAYNIVTKKIRFECDLSRATKFDSKFAAQTMIDRINGSKMMYLDIVPLEITYRISI